MSAVSKILWCDNKKGTVIKMPLCQLESLLGELLWLHLTEKLKGQMFYDYIISPSLVYQKTVGLRNPAAAGNITKE